MSIINELTIRDSLLKILDAEFNEKATRIASDSNVEKSFGEISFSSRSLNDELVRNDEFGLIYIGDVDYDVSKDMARDALATIPYTIQVVFIDKGELTNQISLIRMGLVGCILRSDLDFLQYAEVQITSTTPVDIDAQKSGIIYMSAGILLTVKIGV